jgi:hypothetical protein
MKMGALDDALALFERRAELFRAEAAAVVDTTLRPYRIIEYLAKRFNVSAGAFAVKRYPAALAPRLRGFVWKDSRTIYLASDADRRTEIHEALHFLQPDLDEAEVRRLTAQLDAEADEPVYPATVQKEPAIDYVY